MTGNCGDRIVIDPEMAHWVVKGTKVANLERFFKMSDEEAPITKFCKEWEGLEKRASIGLAGHSTVSEFLRRWMMVAADLAAEERSFLLTSINTASSVLTAQVNRIEEMVREAKEKARLEAELKAQADALKQLEDTRRRGREERQRDEANRRAREKLLETEAEIRRINEDTARILKDGADYRDHMNRMLTNPELYCPRCNQAYADTTKGYWHCSSPRYPYYR